ncbi:MAG: hypothetical protein M3354_11155 [Chloroflexota bacterium]|nr:hypothetical protein [Chloroflexota bacterium]
MRGRRARFVHELQNALSRERLAAYQARDDDDLAAVITYFWNIALCEALYPGLAALEVSMRNGIHGALAAHLATDHWYDRREERHLLLRREAQQVEEAKQKIRKTRKPVTPGRVVAALSYGFWTSLLDSGYGNTIWTPKIRSVLMQHAFPYAPDHFHVRSRVHQRFNSIRFLRNRVFHYEPIWSGIYLPNGRQMHLADLHADIIDAIGWVNPTLQEAVAAVDRFPAMLQEGRNAIELQIKHHFGLP